MNSEYKYAVDLQSKMVDAKRAGRLEGLQAGRLEGERIGEMRGRQEVARQMLSIGMTVSQVVAATGLTAEQVEELEHN